MDIDQLKHFLAKATKKGYASGKKKVRVIEADGSTSVTIQDGPWKSHDNYFGGEPYGGRIIVSYESKPVWMMLYYGRVKSGASDVEKIYGFLLKALALISEEAPYRGASNLVEGDLRYSNVWYGTPEDFYGEEHIYDNGQVGSVSKCDIAVYTCQYQGGFVNVG